MKKELSDEQFDRLMKTVLSDASLADPEIDKIADSPTIWWAVKRDIENRNAAAVSPWPPANRLRRALVFGVPTLAAAVVILSVFVWRMDDAAPNDVVVLEPTEPAAVQSVEPSVVDRSGPMVSAPRPIALTSERVTKRGPAKPVGQTVRRMRSTPEPQEIKTEFIALSYARNPDSGQIVRVKVPSSMMVTFGLVQTVEKPTNLIDAELLVGDDGLTRAIRFVR